MASLGSEENQVVRGVTNLLGQCNDVHVRPFLEAYLQDPGLPQRDPEGRKRGDVAGNLWSLTGQDFVVPTTGSADQKNVQLFLDVFKRNIQQNRQLLGGESPS